MIIFVATALGLGAVISALDNKLILVNRLEHVDTQRLLVLAVTLLTFLGLGVSPSGVLDFAPTRLETHATCVAELVI